MTTYKARCIDGGIYEYIRIVTVDHRLQTMPSAQAGVIDHIDGTDARGRYQRREGWTLMSYATPAATLTASGLLTVDCLCSTSTRRHVSAFLREYAPASPTRQRRPPIWADTPSTFTPATTSTPRPAKS